MKALEQKYTPAQMAAVRAGEEAVNPKDFEKADLRKDPWSLRYLDDLSEIDAVIDKPIRAPYSNTDPRQRLKTEEEIDEGLTEYMNSIGTGLDFSEKGELQASEDPSNDISDVNRQQEEALMNILSSWPEKPSEEQMQRLEDANEKEEAGKEEFYDKVVDMPITVGKEEAERNPRSALAPELFAPGEETLQLKQKKQNKASSDEAEEEASPALQRLIQMTGLSRRQISMLRVKTVYDHQVTNQTRMGKINKTYVLSIAGNSQGLIGIGEGKSDEAGEARLQSQYRAIRNMQPILRYEDRTIFGDVKGKVGATELELFTRPPGKCLLPFPYPSKRSPFANKLHSQVLASVANSTSGRSRDVRAYQTLLPV